MVSFAGLTREDEKDKEEHLQLQLLSLLEHKNEHRFFSKQLKQTIMPNFRPKFKEADPEWRPGCEKPSKKRKQAGPRPRPVPEVPPPGSPEPILPLPVSHPLMEENLSTNLADFAAFFE